MLFLRGMEFEYTLEDMDAEKADPSAGQVLVSIPVPKKPKNRGSMFTISGRRSFGFTGPHKFVFFDEPR